MLTPDSQSPIHAAHNIPNTDRVIDYAAESKDIHSLQLQENGGGGFRVLFAVKPTWAWVCEIVGPLMVACAKLAGGIFLLLAILDIWSSGMFASQNPFARVMWRFGPEIMGVTSLAVGFWIAISAFNWRRYRRFAREPRVAMVNHEGLLDRQPGWLKMRERRVAASEIKDLRLKIYRFHFNRKKTVADLIINKKNGWPIRLRLVSSDAELPEEIARRMATTLGCSIR